MADVLIGCSSAGKLLGLSNQLVRYRALGVQDLGHLLEYKVSNQRALELGDDKPLGEVHRHLRGVRALPLPVSVEGGADQELAPSNGAGSSRLPASTASWTTFEARGIAVVCLGGNAPTQLIKSLRAEIAADFRETVILYAGDYGASGLAMFERLKMRVPGPTYIHVGLTKAQVRQNRLPKAPGKEKVAASEKKAFIKENGEYVQVEIDALDEDVLKGLYETARAPYWDDNAYQDLLEQESAEREELA